MKEKEVEQLTMGEFLEKVNTLIVERGTELSQNKEDLTWEELKKTLVDNYFFTLDQSNMMGEHLERELPSGYDIEIFQNGAIWITQDADCISIGGRKPYQALQIVRGFL